MPKPNRHRQQAEGEIPDSDFMKQGERVGKKKGTPAKRKEQHLFEGDRSHCTVCAARIPVWGTGQQVKRSGRTGTPPHE